jgi:hypothetical protein
MGLADDSIWLERGVRRETVAAEASNLDGKAYMAPLIPGASG